MREQAGRNNVASLFTVQIVPSYNRIRTALDGILLERLFPVFQLCFTALFPDNSIEKFKSSIGYLLALEGTGYLSSDIIHGRNL